VGLKMVENFVRFCRLLARGGTGLRRQA